MKINYRYAMLVALLCAATIINASADSDRKPLHYDDIFNLEEVHEPQFSPSGQQIVYVRVFVDINTDRKYSNLWMVDVDGQHHRPLTTGNFHDNRPLWSPDGKKILFSANRGKGDHTTQLFLLNVKTGHQTQITTAPTAPRAHHWSPDGRHISYLAFVEKPTSALFNITQPPGGNWAKQPIVIDKLHYRFSGQYLPNGEDHLFVVSSAGGTARQITPSGKHYSLSPHQASPPVWSADNRSLIFAANLHPDRERQPLESNLYQINIDSGAITPLVETDGPKHSPVVSPDGRAIAYLGYEGHNYKLVTKIYVITGDNKRWRVLNLALDRSARQLQWSADSKGVFFLYDDKGNTKLGYVSLRGKHQVIAENIGSAAHAYPSGAYHASLQGNVVFTHSRSNSLGQLILTSGDRSNNKKRSKKRGMHQQLLIDVNADILNNRALGSVEEIRYPSSIDRLPIQGWVVKPPNFDASKKYPLIVNLHGGPMSNFGDRFSLMMQIMAAQGYVVLYTNPRGSSSYGESFGEIIHHQAYPGNDFHDVNTGVDLLVQREYIDKENLFITGISYGATLTCWAIGKTDRFRAAVPLAPVTNRYSATLTTEAPVLFQKLSGGFPWENQTAYFKRSPLSLVGQVSTPTLLITGEVDYRNPISETEAYYTALKLQEIEAAMIRLPGEDHSFYRKPSNLHYVLQSLTGWFERQRVVVASRY